MRRNENSKSELNWDPGLLLSYYLDQNQFIEKFVTGSNFDMNLGSAEKTEESEMLIKLKENIMESAPMNEERGLSKIAIAKDIVKFSDELKKKAKKLKPIEFN